MAQTGYSAGFSGPNAVETAQLLGRNPREAASDYYGIAMPDSLHLHLLPRFEWALGKLKLHTNTLYHLAALTVVLPLTRGKQSADAILVRDLKMARCLLKVRWLLHLPPIIYEAHELFAVTVREQMKRRGLDRPEKVRRMDELESYVCGNADGIICTTEHMAEMMRQTHRVGDKMLVAPNGIDLSQYDKLKNADIQPKTDEKKVVMYLGSLHDWKGVDILVGAMKYLPDSLLRVVGGNDKSIARHAELARELGVDDRVQFEGYVAPGKRFRCLQSADVLVLPLRPFQISTYFTSPLKIFEYMAAHKPIVTSDLPSTRELLAHDVNAILIPPEDPRALAEGIGSVLGNPGLGHRLAEQAAVDVQSHTWDQRAARVIEFIKSIQSTGTRSAEGVGH